MCESHNEKSQYLTQVSETIKSPEIVRWSIFLHSNFTHSVVVLRRLTHDCCNTFECLDRVRNVVFLQFQRQVAVEPVSEIQSIFYAMQFVEKQLFTYNTDRRTCLGVGFTLRSAVAQRMDKHPIIFFSNVHTISRIMKLRLFVKFYTVYQFSCIRSCVQRSRRYSNHAIRDVIACYLWRMYVQPKYG